MAGRSGRRGRSEGGVPHERDPGCIRVLPGRGALPGAWVRAPCAALRKVYGKALAILNR